MQEADTLLIKELAAAMCRAQGPAMALLAAAKACSGNLQAVAFVGLAVLSQDKQGLRYAALLTRQRANEQLGAVSPSSAAAGVAILTKQPVHVRDINTGDLGMDDLQYLWHMHNAQSFFAAPLIVSQNAQAALCVASAEPHAFAGREDFLQVVAAMCAPYLTLLTSNLPALEGLLKQVLPASVELVQDLMGSAASRCLGEDRQYSSIVWA
ncbi:hypothetical protein OEZ85_003960 [Tetradesmus obliquus]|uniref:GAF domain-containing protein n=1 Tax=Tetradesmus obliquus TaxID=3088 RepID=A0ABY8UFA4_TETOB|nr:hypothetical protein OEZ85_003960 [Tetradesmus obliquus]